MRVSPVHGAACSAFVISLTIVLATMEKTSYPIFKSITYLPCLIKEVVGDTDNPVTRGLREASRIRQSA